MNDKLLSGRAGEDAVAGYLTGLGHTVIARNWRSSHLELDLVSLFSDGVHFVEVKTRRHGAPALPQDSVGPEKQKHIARAAARFLAANRRRLGDTEAFFDVAAVIEYEDKHLEIEYIPNAFIPIHC